MKNKVKVFLKPEDFINNRLGFHFVDCPARRALVRHFKTNDVRMGVYWCMVNGEEYKVVDGFIMQDYEYVKKQYANPKCDTNYYLTLIKTHES